MKKLRFAILQGLSLSRGQKTIIQMLQDAGLEYSGSQIAAALRHLEILGLIRAVWHQGPDQHRAELTPFGHELLRAV